MQDDFTETDIRESAGENPAAGGSLRLQALVQEEKGRLDPAARALVAQRMQELAEYRQRQGQERIASVAPRPSARPHKPMHPARAALVLVFAVLFLLGFVGFWIGMVVGVPHPGDALLSGSGTNGGLAGIIWSVFLTAMLVWEARRGKLAGAWTVARQVTLPVVGQNGLVIAATVGVAVLLRRLFPWLDRSWLYLLPDFRGHATNLSVLPLQYRYFGLAFGLLLAAHVPQLARGEEMKYRRGTVGWKNGVVRSVRFGLAHCIVGVPLYVGLALTVGGLWFTRQYFRGGIERSTLHHATYNWIVLAVCLIGITVAAFR